MTLAPISILLYWFQNPGGYRILPLGLGQSGKQGLPRKDEEVETASRSLVAEVGTV